MDDNLGASIASIPQRMSHPLLWIGSAVLGALAVYGLASTAGIPWYCAVIMGAVMTAVTIGLFVRDLRDRSKRFEFYENGFEWVIGDAVTAVPYSALRGASASM